MTTASPQMKELFVLLEKVARTSSTVLIRGDSGTGKELVARAVHTLSPRSQGPFRAVNCATFTPELLASELFGHVRGAFTDAVKDRKGLFELADGGTVFLDEIAEMPLGLQAQLLRVLQERAFVPVGGTRQVRVNVRLLSATHKALRREVAKHRFREDLMYRLRVVPLFLPRLVERDGDIEVLLWHFVDGFNQSMERTVRDIEPKALRALLDYSWAGNVRELRNAVEYAFVVGDGEIFRYQDLMPELRGEAPRWNEDPIEAYDPERDKLEAALRRAQGRKGIAAKELGISRSTLWRKLREHRIA